MENRKLVEVSKQYNLNLYVVEEGGDSYIFDLDGEELKSLIKTSKVHVYFFINGQIEEIKNADCVDLLTYDDYFGYYYKFNEKFKYYKEFNALYEEDFNLLTSL